MTALRCLISSGHGTWACWQRRRYRVQKRGSVYFEGFILGCIGIPIGILCGIGGIAVTLRALSDSFMKTVMVATGDSVRLHAIVNWKILVGSVLISALTIFISAWIPAHRASKVTPIEALRQTNTVKVKKAKKLKTSRLRQKLFGFEDVLAVKNYKRNAKRSARGVCPGSQRHSVSQHRQLYQYAHQRP